MLANRLVVREQILQRISKLLVKLLQGGGRRTIFSGIGKLSFKNSPLKIQKILTQQEFIGKTLNDLSIKIDRRKDPIYFSFVHTFTRN